MGLLPGMETGNGLPLPFPHFLSYWTFGKTISVVKLNNGLHSGSEFPQYHQRNRGSRPSSQVLQKKHTSTSFGFSRGPIHSNEVTKAQSQEVQKQPAFAVGKTSAKVKHLKIQRWLKNLVLILSLRGPKGWLEQMLPNLTGT